MRPQLLDRFGLMVSLDNCFDPLIRREIVKARLAFDSDAEAFRQSYAQEQASLARQVREARVALPRFSFDEAVHAEVGARCIDAAVDGLRADLVMLRAARALAALEQAETVTTRHVERVADAVLQHRRRESGREPRAMARDEPSSTMRGAGNGAADNGAANNRRDGSSSHTSAPPLIEQQGRSEHDWGYLPPEPAGMSNVKGVIPLAAKKR